MITYLNGIMLHWLDDALVIDINGIGYQVFVTPVMAHSATVGESIQLHVYHHIKEESQQLFGFKTLDERSLFTLLLSVSGVGPKVALKFLSTFSHSQLSHAIASEDSVSLTAVPGVGKRLAERITVELKGKVETSFGGTDNSTPPPSSHQDIILALRQLGYSAEEARQAVSRAGNEITSTMPLEIALKVVFKYLVTV